MISKKTSGIIIFIILLLTVANATAAPHQNQDFELTADELLIDDANAKVVAEGNVKFSQGELSLVSNQLTARQNLNLIEADGDVEINQLGRKLTAQHLNLNTEEEIATLTGNPKYNAEEILITGKKFEFDLKTGKLIVSQQVYLENKEQSIKAEANNLKYDRQAEEAILTGDVLARKGKRRMTADKMIIDLKTNKIKAEGRTKLVVPNANE